MSAVTQSALNSSPNGHGKKNCEGYMKTSSSWTPVLAYRLRLASTSSRVISLGPHLVGLSSPNGIRRMASNRPSARWMNQWPGSAAIIPFATQSAEASSSWKLNTRE